jgi:glycine dehydrogenase
VAVAADILSLVKLLGEIGAAVVVGTTQRFGIQWVTVDHAAYFATKKVQTFYRKNHWCITRC